MIDEEEENIFSPFKFQRSSATKVSITSIKKRDDYENKENENDVLEEEIIYKKTKLSTDATKKIYDSGKKSKPKKNTPNQKIIDEINEKTFDSDRKKRKTSTKKSKSKAEMISDFQSSIEINHENDDSFLNLIDENISLPDWAQHPYLKDKNGRFPTDEGYDPTTLYIPDGALDKMGKVMRQYWETKAENFDKLIFIKLWKMYYVYNNDALVVQKICDGRIYNWKNATVLYFYQNKLHDYIRKLLDNNQKVILLEPTEKSFNKQSIKREICQIITKGTYIEPNMEEYNSRYCMFIIELYRNFGITYLDTTTHEIFFGEFFDDSKRSQLKTLLEKIRPVEIVYKKSYVSSETLGILKSLAWRPQITSFSKDNLLEIDQEIGRAHV